MSSAKIPTQTACFDLAWKSAVWWDWMVADAVICEPVSIEFGAAGLFTKFPKKINRVKFSR
jgi:hypothetical protein